MNHISSYLKPLPQKKAPREQPRQILVNQLCCELQITDSKHIRGIFFSGLPDSKLRELWQKARVWKVNPAALFFKLISQAKQEQKRGC